MNEKKKKFSRLSAQSRDLFIHFHNSIINQLFMPPQVRTDKELLTIKKDRGMLSKI